MRISDWSSDVCSSDLRAVAVIDPAFAAALFGAVDPLGRTFSLEDSGQRIKHLVVGVSTPVRIHGGLGAGAPDRPSVFVPLPAQPVYELGRSAERRLGEEWCRTCRSRWLPYN